MSYQSPNVRASAATFAQFQSAGASGQLELVIAANNGGTANPSVAATVVASGGGSAGGLLAPGTYYANFTESSGLGETLPSTEAGPITVSAQSAPTGTPTVNVTGSGGALTAGSYYGVFTYVDSNLNAAGVHGETTAGAEFTFTQTSGAEPVITINDGGLPAWASGRNLYLTAAGGASGSEVLAFTGITGTTYTVTANPSVSSTTPPAINTTTTNIPQITAFPALQAGNVARNIYLTSPNGRSGSEVLYAREQTGSTFTFSAAAPASNYAVALPAVNTTAYSTLDYQMLRSVKDGNLQQVYRRLRQIVSDWNRGDSTAPGQAIANLKRVHNVFVVLAELCSEMGALIDANPGHITITRTGIGDPAYRRTWP